MANATQRIAIEIAGRVAASLGKSVDQVNDKLGAIGNMANKVAKIAGAAFTTIKIGEFVSDAVDTYAGFEQAMAQTAATAGATDEQYKAMEEAALAAGRATTKTAEESAQALGYMALAGWDTQQSIEGLMPILRASEAYQTDLAATSDLVTDSLSALGLGVEDLGHYLDVTTMANNKSNQTAGQMMDAFISAGLTLNDLGDSIENVSGLYGLLANRGTKASEAGTAMKAITVNVKKNAKAMEKLGISVYDTEGNFVGISKVLENYNKVTKNMSQKQRDAISLQIAGKDHLGSFNKIMEGFNTTLADGSTEWETLVGNLNTADGALDTMANKTTDTMQGAMARLDSAVDDLKINLVKHFAPYATKAINKVSEVIPKMTEGMNKTIEFIKSNAGPMLEMIKGYVEPFVPYIESVGNSLTKITRRSIELITDTIIPTLKPAFDIVIQVVSGIVQRAVPYISNLVKAFKNVILVVQDITSSLLSKLQPIFSNVFSFISGTLAPKLMAAFDLIAPKVVEIVNKVIPCIQALYNFLSPIIDAIIVAIDFAMLYIKSVISNRIDAVVAIFGHLFDMLGQVIDFITNVFTGNWTAAWYNVVNIFGSIFSCIIDMVKTPINIVIDLVNGVVSKINGISINIPDWVPGIGGKSFGGVNIPEIVRHVLS